MNFGSKKTGQAEAMPGQARLLWPDVLRGLTVISMVLFHGMWDAVFLFGLHAPWYTALPGYLWQQSICWTFILLSGFCFRLGHHPVRRGLQVSVLGLLVTAVTILFMPEDRVVFGVLTCIGACMLLTAALEKVMLQGNLPQDGSRPTAGFRKSGEFAGFVICAALFFLTRNVNTGYLGFEKLRLAALPSDLYRNLFTTFLGFPTPDFFSTDYFSLIPWWFLYLCGYFLYGVWKNSAESGKALRGETDKLKEAAQGKEAAGKETAGKEAAGLAAVPAWIGRHALLVYVLHQPLLMLFFTVGTKLLRA